MGEGMQGVVRPCYTMPAVDFANELVENAQVSDIPARSLLTFMLQTYSCVLRRAATNSWTFNVVVDCTIPAALDGAR